MFDCLFSTHYRRFVANLLKDYAGDVAGGGGARGKRRGAPMGASHRYILGGSAIRFIVVVTVGSVKC